MITRQPAVAGSFYPDTKQQLEEMMHGLVNPVTKTSQLKAKGIISPHAGYVYSGNVAGMLFSHITIPEVGIILAPNHTGLGKSFALWPNGSWQTPLGTTAIDETLNRLIKNCSPLIEEDTLAHLREHSAEVQLPFLQYLRPDIKIVVIVIGSTNLKELKSLGANLGNILCNYPKSHLIIASSDMTHYESAETAHKKDTQALNQIMALDSDQLHKTINDHKISMCGFAPTIVMIEACKILGAQKAELIKYQTSGEVSGDYDEVVGYAGVAII
jgi:MEMO1 family protein